jgi:hypothetical protein
VTEISEGKYRRSSSTYLSERNVQAVRGERKRTRTERHLWCGVVGRALELDRISQGPQESVDVELRDGLIHKCSSRIELCNYEVQDKISQMHNQLYLTRSEPYNRITREEGKDKESEKGRKKRNWNGSGGRI